jgi:DnaK suppressor protein
MEAVAMTKTEVKKFHKVLEMRVVELNGRTRRRDGIAIERSAEATERRIQAAEREIAVRALESESIKLREAAAALNRIANGSYGICVECEEEIGSRRLAAVPWTALCIRCQEAADCRCGASASRFAFAVAA